MSPLEKPLHIDIPVKLSEVKAVFSVGALAFEGDLPASIFHLQLVSSDTADWNAKAQVIAIFHTNAGHVMLHDIAYNADRNIATGNPYKILLVPQHSDYDWSISSQSRMGMSCGATRISMLRATPG